MQQLTATVSMGSQKFFAPVSYPPKYIRTFLLGEEAHFINNSRSKHLCVGLSPHLNFAPAIIIGGSRVAPVLLCKEDWELILQNQGVILNYLHGDKNGEKPLVLSKAKLYFGSVGDQKVLKIEDESEVFVSLALETVESVFNKAESISKILEELNRTQFGDYYASIIKRIKNLPGDIKSNIDTVLQQIDAEDGNVRLMFDIVNRQYNRVIGDILLCSA